MRCALAYTSSKLRKGTCIALQGQRNTPAVFEHAMIGIHNATDAVHLGILEVAVERVAVRDCAAGDARSKRERSIPPAHAQSPS